MRVGEMRFTNIVCRYCGCQLPYGWGVALVEPIVPRFIGGQVDLEQNWLDEFGAPVLAPAIFSSTGPEEVVEGLEELNDEEQEWMEDEGLLPKDCWQEIVDALSGLVPDEQATDHPLSCDFCNQDLVFGEGALRIRHCEIQKPRRKPRGAAENQGILVPVAGLSDYLMCLSCAYTMSREIVPEHNGQDLWPSL